MDIFRYKQNRLQQLRGFCAVVEAKSVSKGAARLRLTQPTVSLQVQALERELRVDFCIGPLLDVPPDLEFEPVVSFDPVLITAATHPLANRRQVTLRQISQYPLIMPPRHLSTWRQVELVFQNHGLRYEVRME